MTFRGNGTAEFLCIGGCAVPGVQTEPYSPAAFASLVTAFREAGFLDLPHEVGMCVDCGTVKLKYRDQSDTNEVLDLGFAKLPKLAAMEKRVGDAARMFDRFARPSPSSYQQLLDAGWDPNKVLDANGGTMLNYAVAGSDPAAVRVLLNRGAKVNRRALERAIDVPILSMLWRAARISPALPQARALLTIAASSNLTDNIEWLVVQGLDVNADEPRTGITPLMAAARSDSSESVTILLRLGARFDRRDTNGRTPLMHAAESCAASTIRVLVFAGSDARLKDKAGRRALDLVPAGRAGWIAECQAARTALTSR